MDITGNTRTLELIQGQCPPTVLCALPASGPPGELVKDADFRVQCQAVESQYP